MKISNMPEHVINIVIDEPKFKLSAVLIVEGDCREDGELSAEMEFQLKARYFDYAWFKNDVRDLKSITEHMSKLFVKTVGR